MQTGPLWLGASVAQREAVMAAPFAVLSPGTHSTSRKSSRKSQMCSRRGEFAVLRGVVKLDFTQEVKSLEHLHVMN